MIKGRKIMKLQELIQNSKHELDSLNVEDADIKLKILIEYVFKISKEKLILKYKDEINDKKVEEFRKLLKKLENGIPIQYIINNQEFMGLNFYVDENVLIPQPDTEILVEEVIKYCNELRNNESEDKETNKDYKENIEKEPIINKEDKNINKKTIKILDLCTGSGIIGISIYKYLENVEIYASDISQKALNIAEKNTNLNNAKINFINSDMFENIHIKDFDIIVSNPPYIESKVIESLSKEVQNEPKLALDGGEDGLKFYRCILENAKDYLRKNGAIFLEIGYDQKEKIEEILKSYKIYKETKCIKDFGGNNRVIIIKR
jgi:release factor glutamine methyltransferase